MPQAEPDNNDRAKWARVGLEAFADEVRIGDEDIFTQMSDFLADLMHLADMEGVEFEHLLSRATDHYTEEVEVYGRASKSPKAWSPRRRRR